MRTFYIYDRYDDLWRVFVEEFITIRGNKAMLFTLLKMHTNIVVEVVRYSCNNNGGYYCDYEDGKFTPVNIRHMFPKWDLRNINRLGGNDHVVS